MHHRVCGNMWRRVHQDLGKDRRGVKIIRYTIFLMCQTLCRGKSTIFCKWTTLPHPPVHPEKKWKEHKKRKEVKVQSAERQRNEKKKTGSKHKGITVWALAVVNRKEKVNRLGQLQKPSNSADIILGYFAVAAVPAAGRGTDYFCLPWQNDPFWIIRVVFLSILWVKPLVYFVCSCFISRIMCSEGNAWYTPSLMKCLLNKSDPLSL